MKGKKALVKYVTIQSTEGFKRARAIVILLSICKMFKELSYLLD